MLSWRNLEVWKASHGLAVYLYSVIKKFPADERYGLSSQMKRAASSVPANIVEGQSRDTSKDYLRFLFNSRGSLEELRYFVLLSKDLNFISPADFVYLENECEKISKMLNGLIRNIKGRCSNV